MSNAAKHLQHIFSQLPATEQETLLAFAEFLHSRSSETPTVLASPILTPRPPKESVVAAIKRLSKSYYMLNKSKMLDETSNLMTEHILRGRDAKEVIDELETVFRRHYEELKNQST